MPLRAQGSLPQDAQIQDAVSVSESILCHHIFICESAPMHIKDDSGDQVTNEEMEEYIGEVVCGWYERI